MLQSHSIMLLPFCVPFYPSEYPHVAPGCKKWPPDAIDPGPCRGLEHGTSSKRKAKNHHVVNIYQSHHLHTQKICLNIILVGGWATPLKNMTSSVGIIRNPRYGKIKNGNQTTNQFKYDCFKFPIEKTIRKEYTGTPLRSPPSNLELLENQHPDGDHRFSNPYS